MLKALELVGFKSFADKTRFEFPSGITVVVGPNGSGKSNVVDAIKWVLGEQSARSLRGKEMADVIFKGSGGGQRKPANMAEATITFDNSDRLIDLSTPEVQVTRRVYRGGEGEYLINGQPSRLKDIKQLFRGTGVGTDAYSLIEQGKVDSLLQASSDDRRAIFEEAAGISRFKAKKIEAERRIARVEQNLLRLSDIVDEVDARLRKLRSQAAKARRYKEISDRLQSLRTHTGQIDWLHLTARLLAGEAEYQSCVTKRSGLNESLRRDADSLQQIESELADHDAELQEKETAYQQARERFAAVKSSHAVHAARIVEIQGERERTVRRLQEMRSQSLLDSNDTRGIECQVNQVLANIANHEQALERHQTAVEASQSWLAEFQPLVDVRLARDHEIREQVRENERQIARWQGDIESAQEQRAGASAKLIALEPSLAEAAAELQQRQELLATLSSEADRRRQRLEEQYGVWKESNERIASLRHEWTEVHERGIAVAERVTVLEEFDQRQEGIGAGVQALLARSGPHQAPPFNSVHGIVADLIEVRDTAHANLISLALAEREQHIVVTGGAMIETLRRESIQLPGRVGIIRVPSAPPPAWSSAISLDGQPGVIDRADRLVSAEPEFANLVQWLLGDTWIVDTLENALRLSKLMNAPVRFVTSAGELLERDGRLLIGPPEASDQLLSRRAELRDLRIELHRLQTEQGARSAELEEAGQVARKHEADVEKIQAIDLQTRSDLAKAELAVDTAKGAVANLTERRDEVAREEQAGQERERKGTEELNRCTKLADELSHQLATLAGELEQLQQDVRRAESDLATARHAVTAQEVLLNTCRTQCDALTRQLARVQEARLAREQEFRQWRQDALRAGQRIDASEIAMLALHAEFSELAITIERDGRRIEQLRVERKEQASRLASLRDNSEQLRSALHDIEQRQHAAELEASRVRLERQTLADRLKEDYGIDLTHQPTTTSDAELEQRAEVDREILDLRGKLTQLGAVNMDALAELTDLEDRYQKLSSQYKDLVDAKTSLERIIEKINADSRTIYAETLEAVRANFQVLFRKVFGGGRADIVLEEGKDLLESGIDILATPPGKHSLNLSLLSGGERALTAVTLLLALFQYRPSPFCVLDEVDGPLDEANIGRFVGVLKEFLQWTRFVVVTHSKKTMTAANTLYGVTMQESGVSKRVSVRFEDVNEQGEIIRTRDDDERGAA